MLDPALHYFGLHFARALPLDESLLPLLRIALPLVLSVVSGGVWAARLLAGRGGAHLQAGCRRHDWMRVEGRFICLRCSYEAGSSRVMGARRR